MRPIRLRGARTNNLQDLDLDIEPGSFVVIAGPSGAGKSSLAFGTLYAEGQRRYVESFSAYARQFLERLARPPIRELDPVPAGIAVDRQAPVRTSRSTVGTMTEVADCMKTLWARTADLVCPGCGEVVYRDAPSTAADRLLGAHPNGRVVVTYPVEVPDPEAFLGVREKLLADGYTRIRTSEGAFTDVGALRPSEAVSFGGRLDVVADRLVANDEGRTRLVEALEAAMDRGRGRADVWSPEGRVAAFSKGLHCPRCDRSFREPAAALFSFNSPIGACPTCRGFGRTIGVDLDRVIPDKRLSIAAGAVKAFQGKSASWERKQVLKHAEKSGVPIDVPVETLSEAHWNWLVDGDPRGGYPKHWFGIRGWFRWMESRAYKMHVRVFLSRYRKYEECADCDGARLKPDALVWRVQGRTIADFFATPASEALRFLGDPASGFGRDPATALLHQEASSRLEALCDVGLGYLALDRASRTLSGGEAQRVALTGAIGASLNGAMFVLDEPTVGLHPADVEKLVHVLRALAKGENIAIVVEHDPEVVRAADRVIELGPGAGANGGRIVFDGAPEDLARADTATGRSLRPTKTRRVASKRARPATGTLRLRGATGHNLRGVDLAIPHDAITCVTGPSGSGKSSLILETLVPAVARALGRGTSEAPLPFVSLEGVEGIESVLAVDQSPLGRTSRGNPATYLKAWDVLRKRFAATDLAKERGYTAGTFSFNVEGGRCEACRGEGAETVEMQFLADVSFSCPECGGKRFVGPVLEVQHRGKSIADVLDMTVAEACEWLADDPAALEGLDPLRRVGVDYLRIGQPLNTLSGGEAQRLKLAFALSQAHPRSLVVLDEPTAGLHAEEVRPLLAALDALVESGHTVVVIEHDMEVAAFADRVVELGPGAGDEGGRIVAEGTPEDVARSDAASAPYLASVLLGEPVRARRRPPLSSPPGPPERVIAIRGAREHNLRRVDLDIPRNQLVVVTGPSGSGKSTLAFDVLFAEGQRRYLETLSPYARQYMPQLPRPAVDRVVGVPPCVSLEQRMTRGGVTSTVATVTEVAHYLRLLWARAGLVHCPDHGLPIAARSPDQMHTDLVALYGPRAEVELLGPVVRGRKGMHKDVLARVRKAGFTHAVIDGTRCELVVGMKLDRYHEHEVEVVVGRASLASRELRSLLAGALELGDGTVRAVAKDRSILLSTKRACPACGRGLPELDPRFFSFNTKQGQCPTCEGRGEIVEAVGRGPSARETTRPCEDCRGTRLSPLARSVTVAGRRIDEVLGRSVVEARAELDAMELLGREATIGDVPKKEARARLDFLERVGLGYLGLDRAASTLSGGELQRVRLAAQLGTGLTGVLYVLDEPTIGLHPRDTGRLLDALRALVDRGSSVVVVEHDAETILASDHVIDIGPGGGHHGGRVVAQGSPEEVQSIEGSVTGASLRRAPPIPAVRRSVAHAKHLTLRGVRHHNLKTVDLRLPLGRFVAVTGVSGSGKSSLVREVLLRATRDALGLVNDAPAGFFASLEGVEALGRAIEVDQSPIGRTPRSVPATYVGIWDETRKLLAGTPEARARGYKASRFSFNVEGGRCPGCAGQGALTVEMAFLPDVLVLCEACGGARFEDETLGIRWRGLSAAEILGLEIDDAVSVFEPVSKIHAPLVLLRDLGLGYLKLGQASNTLSGGEAQRMKLVAELASAPTGGPTLYVMDEPTTGLHRDDVRRLLGVLGRFVERGDTVVVIEHHPDVMAAVDWIVDLGPEGGSGGGRIVAEGTPEDVARAGTATSRVLAETLAGFSLPASEREKRRRRA